MAVATGALRKRQSLESKAAAKAKRDKLILVGGSVLLVAVLAFELPKRPRRFVVDAHTRAYGRRKRTGGGTKRLRGARGTQPGAGGAGS